MGTEVDARATTDDVPRATSSIRAKAALAARVARAELSHLHLRDLTRPSRGTLARFVFGLSLVPRLVRAARRDEAFRRRHARWTSVQVAIVVVVAAVLVGLGSEVRKIPSSGRTTFEIEIAILLLVYTTLATVEWIVIALGRQFHDQISRGATLAVALVPEDPERVPRVAIDVPWLKKRVRRYFRGLIAFGAGVPAIVLGSLLPWVGGSLASVMITLWSTYWVGVLTAGKSALAWRTEGDPRAPDPFVFRAGDEMTTRVPLLRLGLPRLYFKVWRRLSFGLFPPARELEAQTPEMMGIAAFRALVGMPGLYLFFRPFFPVASQLVIATESVLRRDGSAELEVAGTLADAEGPREADARPHRPGELAQLAHPDALVVRDGELDDAVAALGRPEKRVDGERVALAVEVEGPDRAGAVAAHPAVDVGGGDAVEEAREAGEGAVGEVVGDGHRGRA